MKSPYAIHSPDGEQGFTLVEVLVMMAVLLISLAGLAVVSTILNRNAGQFQTSDQGDDAIAFDISEVRRINNRYTCRDVTTNRGPCSILNVDPSQNDYFPTTSEGQENFRNRCDYDDGDLSIDLVSDLAAQIPSNSDASSALNEQGVQRTLITNDQGNAHRYSVSYSRDGTLLRILSLVPTAASWCP